VLLTIARNLGEWNKAFGDKLRERLTKDHSLSSTTDIKTQWESLISDPSHSAKAAGPAFIVIDALDESGGVMDRKVLLQCLVEKSSDLPSNFRILVTSREETDVKEAIDNGKGKVLWKQMNSLPNTVDDIRRYVQEKFQVAGGDQSIEWGQVADKAEGNFLFASISCDYILEDTTPGITRRERFLQVTSTSLASSKEIQPEFILDRLFLTVLRNIFARFNGPIQKRYTTVMGYVVGALAPVSRHMLYMIHQYSTGCSGNSLDVARDEINSIIGFLGSLLTGISGDKNDVPIQLCHTSFREFLCDKNRSGEFSVDISFVHQLLSTASLQLMSSPSDGLKFNICNLPTSYLPNNKIPDLQKRVQDNINPVLSYACQFWAKHLQLIGKDQNLETLLTAVSDFFKTKFIFWVEVLSLLSELRVAAQSISIIRDCLQKTASLVSNKHSECIGILTIQRGYWNLSLKLANFLKSLESALMSQLPTYTFQQYHCSPVNQSFIWNIMGPKFSTSNLW